MIPFGDIDLQREVNLKCHSGVVDRRHVHGVRRVYTANIEGRRSSATVAIYQGDGAEEVRCIMLLRILDGTIVRRSGGGTSKNI
jgi:hypothetical protein